MELWRWILLVAVVCVSGFVAGCDTQRDGLKDVFAPVRGTVTYLGQPLPNALVVSMPETPDVLPASGLTESDGRYELMTIVQGDGASVGRHRVTITARGPDNELSGDAIDPAGSDTEPGEPLIPEKYFMPDTSGLVAEVKRGDNTVNFDLTAEVKPDDNPAEPDLPDDEKPGDSTVNFDPTDK